MMRGDEINAIEEIPELLHDAILGGVTWDPDLGALRLDCQGCLRRGTDGQELENRDVRVSLEDLEGLAAGLEPSNPFQRPSCLPPPPSLDPSVLVAGVQPGTLVGLGINDDEAVDDAAKAISQAELFGTLEKLKKSPIRVVFWLSGSHFGIEEYGVLMVCGCKRVACTTVDGPLSIKDWAAQFEAWWKGWSDYWQERSRQSSDLNGTEVDSVDGDGEAAEICEEATLIPAGETSVDTDYLPPQEPIFLLEPTDLPEPIQKPLRDHFVGLHMRDWKRMARSESPMEDPAKLAEELERFHRSEGWGRWGYPRMVDEWWREGDRAMVMLRGVEHSSPVEDLPAENVESVWTFLLRYRSNRWIITKSAQGWPPYGSARSLPTSRKPWLDNWKSGSVTS